MPSLTPLTYPPAPRPVPRPSCPPPHRPFDHGQPRNPDAPDLLAFAIVYRPIRLRTRPLRLVLCPAIPAAIEMLRAPAVLGATVTGALVNNGGSTQSGPKKRVGGEAGGEWPCKFGAPSGILWLGVAVATGCVHLDVNRDTQNCGFGTKKSIHPLMFSIRAQNVHPPPGLGPTSPAPPWFWAQEIYSPLDFFKVTLSLLMRAPPGPRHRTAKSSFANPIQGQKSHQP